MDQKCWNDITQKKLLGHMGTYMVINHFHQWNIQVSKEGWDTVLQSIRDHVNQEEDEFFEDVTQWMRNKWKENYDDFSNQLADPQKMKMLMDKQMGWPRKRKWDNNLAKKIPNHGFFEQWKYVGMHCKLHPNERLTTFHMDQNIKNRQRVTRFVLDPLMKATKELTIQMWGLSKELGKLSLMVAKKIWYDKERIITFLCRVTQDKQIVKNVKRQ